MARIWGGAPADRRPSAPRSSPKRNGARRGSRHPGDATAGQMPSAQRPSPAWDGAWRGSRHPVRRLRGPGAVRAAPIPDVGRRAVWLMCPCVAPHGPGVERPAAIPDVGRRAAWLVCPRGGAIAGRMPSAQRPFPAWDCARCCSRNPGRSPRVPVAECAAAVPHVGLCAMRLASPGAEFPPAGGVKRAAAVHGAGRRAASLASPWRLSADRAPSTPLPAPTLDGVASNCAANFAASP